MSRDLEWLLIRVRRLAKRVRTPVLTTFQKYNSHVVKRLPEGPLFSKEAVCNICFSICVFGRRLQFLKGNLLNIHSHKYSGLTNSKVSPSAANSCFTSRSQWQRSQTISIQQDKGVIQIVTRKPKSSSHAVASGVAKSTLRNRTGSRRALGATSKLFKSGYRPDLRRVSVKFTVVPLSFPPPCPSWTRSVWTNAPSRARWSSSYLESWVWTCVLYQTSPRQEPIKLLLVHFVMSLSDAV